MKIKELKEEHPAIYKIAMNYLRQLPIGIIDQANPDMDDFNWHKTSEGFTFWCSIENGNFQVFYDRYPEYSKKPVNVEEKYWSKSPYELLKKCEMDYPHGTDALFGRCKRPGKVSWPLKFVECQGVSDNDRNMVFTFEYGFAEIVSQPQLNGKVPFVSMDECEVEFRTIGELAPEPKAGDMVEYSDDAIRWEGNLRYTGGKTSSGLYIVEENDVTLCFKHIRLPQKSEVESKANELLVNVREGHYDHVGDQHMITKKWLIEKMIEIAKWGQQNPNAK